MLGIKDIEGRNVVEMHYSGSLSVREMKQARESIKQMPSERGQVNLFVAYGEDDLERVDFAAWTKELESIGLLGAWKGSP
ncbi:hypothetical protein ACTXOR_10695 [Arthrobacter rhombi]|uniref:hypothetical protein n=1 Tax=Arthrobacter rhombi TaxID=71253 RepID=UPI003FD3F4C2